MSKLLLVDDDIELTTMLTEYLEREGFDITAVHNGDAAVREALNGDYALVVLDVMMPGMSGIEALSRIRTHSKMPVLMLTARGDDIDRIIGLELGADDYVPKPCMPRELVARIRAILRRTREQVEDDPIIRVGDLEINEDSHDVTRAGQTIDLSPTEYKLLPALRT